MKEAGFSSKMGFILAAAGSAVGLGNIWRFPYLAAKYGGGSFLLIYLILTVTFGFSLMITEIAIGRKTGGSPFSAYGMINKKLGFIGIMASLIPAIILPYYCVIGGWVTKYSVLYLTGQGNSVAGDGTFFGKFIGETTSPMIFTLIYLSATAVIVAMGVQKGVEKISKIMMPVLIVLCVLLVAFVATIPGTVEGFKYYFKPDFSKITLNAVFAAMGQLFYSLSLAMGIMITYGSYVSKSENIEKSVRSIEVFDTGVAFLAGAIIVPSVYALSPENLDTAGPGLMFEVLPTVFSGIKFGSVVGTLFFVLVLFAALTSSISLMEAVVSVVEEKFKLGRKPSVLIVYVFSILLAVPSSLGYGLWKNIKIIGMQFLDFFDFISNAVLMPVAALLTCILVGYIAKPKAVIEEVESSAAFKSKKLYIVLIKYVSPIIILIVLISSVLNALGIIKL